MAKLPIQQIQANYADDQKMLEGSQIIEVDYDDDEGKILLSFDIGKDGHVVTFWVDTDDLFYAINKARNEIKKEAE